MKVRSCVVGGGPAGMMLGFLLARAGVDVVVLEKHADFLRDFRGDTIHPSTLEAMHELGLLDAFLKRPHDEVRHLTGWVGNFQLTIADFSRLPTHCPFIALMPQWDFLAFLAEEARRYPGFHVMMQADAQELIVEGGLVRGVRAQTPEGRLDIEADLVVGADGRHSVIREKAGFSVQNFGAPMDVFWMRLSRQPSDPAQTLGRFDRGKILVMLNRTDYWQCAYVIPKGMSETIRQRGLAAFRAEVAEAAPFLGERMEELRDWDQVKLLTVTVDRLRHWARPGLLCIGDAAHAMSPIGGVGINLAVQDAIAAANILAVPLREGKVSLAHLEKVQRRRTFPTAATQCLQVLVQNRVITPALAQTKTTSLSWPLRLLRRWPGLARLPARLLGLGFRPEHIQTPDIHKGQRS